MNEVLNFNQFVLTDVLWPLMLSGSSKFVVVVQNLNSNRMLKKSTETVARSILILGLYERLIGADLFITWSFHYFSV